MIAQQGLFQKTTKEAKVLKMFIVSDNHSARHMGAAFNMLAGKIAVTLVNDFFKEITTKYGQQAQETAGSLTKASVGKKIKSASEAIAALEKYQANIYQKFSQAGLNAIGNAIESMNQDDHAKNLKTFSTAFTFIGCGLNALDITPSLVSGIKTGVLTHFS